MSHVVERVEPKSQMEPVSKPRRSYLRAITFIIPMLIVGTIVVLPPGQLRRSVIVVNGTTNELRLDKVVYKEFDQKLAKITEHVLATNVVIPPKSKMQFPHSARWNGSAEVTISAERPLIFSMSFGWGKSDMFTYSGASCWMFAGQQSTLRLLFEKASSQFPALNRFR